MGMAETAAPAEATREDGLTKLEGYVLDALVEAVSWYEELPVQHPNERDEFFLHIHALQDMLATRAMRRLYPQAWVNHATAE